MADAWEFPVIAACSVISTSGRAEASMPRAPVFAFRGSALADLPSARFADAMAIPTQTIVSGSRRSSRSDATVDADQPYSSLSGLPPVLNMVMRTRCQVWLALAVFAVLAVDPVVTSAQPIIGRARWCATLPFGGMMQCSYSALEHCMTYARGVSNQCSLNPWYEGPPNPPRKRPRRGASTLGPH